MKQSAKLIKYVTLVCIMIMAIFATKKTLAANNEFESNSERDVISKIKRCNVW